MQIILASSSIYRQSVLKKLQIPFSSMAPNVDEAPMLGESVDAQVTRLAENKASAIAVQPSCQDAYVIGSDQLASIDGLTLGKPGNFEAAKQQLQQASGKTVRFHTALCLMHYNSQQKVQVVDTYDVKFKTLSDKHISTYLTIEQPYDCAGSFKSEGLGIALFESMQGNDPNALIGLPLISLVNLFSVMSIDLFDFMQPR